MTIPSQTPSPKQNTSPSGWKVGAIIVAGILSLYLSILNLPTTESSVDSTADATVAISSTDPAADNKPAVPHSTNVFVDSKDVGGCRELLGNIIVTVVFVDDPSASWTPAAIEAEKQELLTEAKTLEGIAAQYGQSLTCSFIYQTAAVSITPTITNTDTFAEKAVPSAALPSRDTLNASLKSTYACDQAPVLFCLNHGGRSFAHCDNADEYAVLFQESPNPFIHEILHLFGAEDFYYPDEAKSLAGDLFPTSVMLSSDSIQVDELTAYLIGWHTQPSAAAEQFLTETDHITADTMAEEYQKATYTGHIDSYYDGAGTYTGDMVDGSFHGQGDYRFANGDRYSGAWQHGLQHGIGTYRWTDGNIYVGEWMNGQRHGYGTITWADGSDYSGDWQHDKRQGQGIMTWADGTRYEGAWVDGNMHGAGILYDNHGAIIYQGTWKNNAFMQ